MRIVPNADNDDAVNNDGFVPFYPPLDVILAGDPRTEENRRRLDAHTPSSEMLDRLHRLQLLTEQIVNSHEFAEQQNPSIAEQMAFYADDDADDADDDDDDDADDDDDDDDDADDDDDDDDDNVIIVNAPLDMNAWSAQRRAHEDEALVDDTNVEEFEAVPDNLP